MSELAEDLGYRLRPLRVLLASGAVGRAAQELEEEGISRPLLVTTPGRWKALPPGLRGEEVAWAGVFSRARVHIPQERVDEAMALARKVEADGLVAFGGGSATGMAKAVALETGLPVVAIPTTFSGSENTAIWGVRGDEGKSTGRATEVAPRVIIYDPDLLAALPPRVAAASGMNAVAHSVGALTSHSSHLLARLLAREGLETLMGALPGVMDGVARARRDAFWGAHLSGRALDMSTMGLHHRLCHILGGRLDLPHAVTHAVLLPFTTLVTLERMPQGQATILDVLNRGWARQGGRATESGGGRTGGKEVARAFLELNQRLGLPIALSEMMAEGSSEMVPQVEASHDEEGKGGVGQRSTAAAAPVSGIQQGGAIPYPRELMAQVTEEALGSDGGYHLSATGPEISALLKAAWEGALP
jgi:maleylacetate reductase